MPGDITRKVEVTVGIPTAGRPYCLAECLAELHALTKCAYEVVIVYSAGDKGDGRLSSAYERLFASYPVTVVRFDGIVPPGEARSIIAQRCVTPFIQFLDDDLLVTSTREGSSVDTLLRNMKATDYEILSGVWEERGVFRDAGYLHLETTLEGSPRILRVPVRPRFEQFPSNHSDVFLTLDDVQPSIMARTSLFGRMNFDKQFMFYFEIYDFFMQARKAGLKVGVNCGVVFKHRPKRYARQTNRQLFDISEDRSRFSAKWGVRPLMIEPPWRTVAGEALSWIYSELDQLT